MNWRLVIVLLVTAVSPVAATVCEVACASPGHTGHGAAPTTIVAPADDHAHHHHDGAASAAPVPGPSVTTFSSTECDPLDGLPARVRTVQSDPGDARECSWTVFLAYAEAARVTVARHSSAPPPLLPPLLATALRI